MKLYCGTYAKYNAGSIFGKWMDLDKYANADDFEAACRKLHADEADPEFMFQDYETDAGEDWQEGLYSESSIPREYWKLKAEAEAEKKAAAKGGARAKEKAEQDRLCKAYTEARCGSRIADPRRWEREFKYYRGTFYFYALADGVICTVERPIIQTRFCCGEDDRGQGGEEYGTMAYALKSNAEKRTERGFTFANLHDFDTKNECDNSEKATAEYRNASEESREQMRLRRRWGDNVLAVVRRAHGDLEWQSVGMPLWDTGLGIVRLFDADDFRRMREAVAHVRADFVKRLAAWWKRFGADHIHTWTYWTEA